MSLLDDYRLLEIPTHATEQEAKAAFRRLARRYHPDKNPTQDTTAHFQKLQLAYQNILAAIKRGEQVNDWQPFQFSTENPSYTEPSHTSQATDAEQRAYIKEQQRIYEEMRRNNAHQDKARNDAIQAARNALNEKRVKALYEEAFKNNKAFNYAHTDNEGMSEEPFRPNDTFQPEQPSFHEQMTSTYEASSKPQVAPIRLYAAKAAFRVVTYIVCFAAGIYATLYWQSNNVPVEATAESRYQTGLYPQYRTGLNHTIKATSLKAEPHGDAPSLTQIPALQDIQSIKAQGDWLTVRYQQTNGWVDARDIGFGGAQQALQSQCLGQPGAAPKHGTLIGDATGNSRLRILNQLPTASLLTFESFDGRPPFSIYLYAKQAYAANFIPRGQYRLSLETGSLYHHACNKFLFDDKIRVILNNVDFASTEQSLTLQAQ